ncbi:MAG TPA: amino acid ABC transporter permease [Candidatus Limnocylindrales bacterium]|nr:amino acid ABC transporter permease [Candidatus Limnocylindrales bacterium]
MTTAPGHLPPPVTSVGIVGWLRRNLFNSPLNSALTVIVGVILVLAVVVSLNWVLTDAKWGVVTTNFRLFMIGQYPADEAWRVWLAVLAVSLLTGISAASTTSRAARTLAMGLSAGQALLGLLAMISDVGIVAALALFANAALVWVAFALATKFPISSRARVLIWLVMVPVLFLLLQGFGEPILRFVPTNLWGGLLLTFLLAVGGIVLSFPIGVLLALGRRSNLPVVRILSTAYIEIIRGVPLVTLLFLAAIMLPLVLPGDLRIEHVFRALAGLTLFTAAYVAENVRGGLQAIPSGQIEAADAIGLSTLQRNLYVVLPQALRSVIPANVGLFISLLKDTTLVAIAGTGLLELLGVGRAVVAQPAWIGTELEVYVFISAVFFFMCYVMSQASYRLEAELGVGKR